MRQFCVFCGQKPKRKNIEHVIPRWLIELTGSPKREAIFGPFWNDNKKDLDVKKIPFDQFGFPACDRCNNKFSDLEAETKHVVESLLEGLPLSSKDFSTLLTWLDKVRIGVWLGVYYLHHKVSDIEPHMFIEGRMNRTDRLVLIYRFDEAPKRLVLMGTMTPAFLYLPCCFSLLINDVALLNVATDFIVSRPLGLPYPKQVSWDGWPRLRFKMAPGKERVSLPLLRMQVDSHCTQICQPMFTQKDLMGETSDLYGTDYVRSMMAEESTGIGKVLICKDQSLAEYPAEPSLYWEPTTSCDSSTLREIAAVQALRLQMYLVNQSPKSSQLEPDRAEIAKRQRHSAIAHNRKMIEEIRLGHL